MTKVGTRANLAVEISAGYKTFCCRTMCQRKSGWGVSYGILLQNYEGLWELCWEVFRGYFLWFSEICLREEAVAVDFCGAFVIFLELFESRICTNACDAEYVLFSCG